MEMPPVSWALALSEAAAKAPLEVMEPELAVVSNVTLPLALTLPRVRVRAFMIEIFPTVALAETAPVMKLLVDARLMLPDVLTRVVVPPTYREPRLVCAPPPSTVTV
jgi:hypothetical protein